MSILYNIVIRIRLLYATRNAPSVRNNDVKKNNESKSYQRRRENSSSDVRNIANIGIRAVIAQYWIQKCD